MVGGTGATRRGHDSATLASAAAAVGAGAVHLDLAPAHFEAGGLWLGLGFVVSGLLLVAGGVGVIAAAGDRARRPSWTVLGVAAAVSAEAYFVSRTIGLPAHGREPWDVVGLVTTAAELLVVGAALVVVRPRLSRRLLAPVLAALLLAPAAARASIPPSAAPARCLVPTRTLTLYAQEIAPGLDGKRRLAFGTSPSNAAIPGPLIELTEGDCLAVPLVNHVSADTLRAIRDDGRWPSDPSLPLGISLHPHGVRYTPASDGTVHTGSFVPPGQARTYLWFAAPRAAAGSRVASPGSAGYWWYHDHVAGTDHGTGGLASGLFGGLIVRRASDPLPDRTFVVGMGGPAPMINFHQWPESFACDRNGNTPGPDCFVATVGQRVEFLVIGVPGTLAREDMHAFHLHGHTWADNRTGLLTAPDDETRVIDAKSVAPSESFGFQVTAGEDVGAGDWMLHCHIQEHSDRGMLTFFRVLSGQIVTSPVHANAGHTHEVQP
jgi:FtsP/CotA-like multicopper oxidase with cupredoxin domain